MINWLLDFIQAGLMVSYNPIFWAWFVLVAWYLWRLRERDGLSRRRADQIGCTAWLLGAIVIGMVWRYQFPASWFRQAASLVSD